MTNIGLVYPVLQGKESVIRDIVRQLKERRSEYQQSRQRGGVTLERAYLQRNPDGTSLVVAYLEANRGFRELMATLVDSDIALDREFIAGNSEATGVDFSAGLQGPEPELVGEYVASGASGRGRGFAFAAPLQPGKTDDARRFAREAYATRRTELAEARSADGVTRECVFLNQTPAGDVIVVYLEAANPNDANRRFAESNAPFDRWFKDECKKIFPPFIDFDQPVPENEEIFSSDV
ncbi:MAG TPA: DUF6176 family protein [Chloroflexota bacterium]|jgi:hypothetical protein